MEWLEVSASSVEAAKAIALDRLGIHESDAEFEIITEGKIGIFGRMKEEARIRARVLPIPVRPKNARVRNGRRSKAPTDDLIGNESGQHITSSNPALKQASPKQASTRNTTVANPQKTVQHKKANSSFEDQAKLVESFVSGIAETMDLNVEFTRCNLEDDMLRIEAIGDDIGILIGKRGATSKAIDDLARTILQRSGYIAHAGKVCIDIGGVEARRLSALSEFAKSVAVEVLEHGQEIRVEPMNRIDRKIIHDTVAVIDGVGTRSEGNDTMRHVVIGLLSPNH